MQSGTEVLLVVIRNPRSELLTKSSMDFREGVDRDRTVFMSEDIEDVSSDIDHCHNFHEPLLFKHC